MRSRLLAFATLVSRPAVALGGSVALAALAVALAWYLNNVSPTGAFAAATIAPLAEEVDVSGSVEGARTTDLSFQISGQVASIPAQVGDRVAPGQTLVALSGSAQAAALQGAEAGLETAEANLAALAAGTRPEELSIDQKALRDAIGSAYVSADTAVHATADQLFTSPRTPTAALAFTVSDATLADTVVRERVALEPALAAWGAQVAAPSFATDDPEAAAAGTEQDLAQTSLFLGDLAQALTRAQSSPNVSGAAIVGYEANIAAARATLAAALSSVTGAAGALALAEAGATPQAIAVAKAGVDAAQAQVRLARVALDETVMTAPIAGTVTVQNAHLGQTVAPGVPLVSLIGTGAFEAKAPVSEGDIGKIRVGESALATFDAYPGQSFPATITAVDPAATMANGVASYQVTATFTTADPRIQSGLTAHLAIRTAALAEALVVPASAVISDQGASFVYLKTGSGAVKTPVTTGAESSGADGTGALIQILSGLSAEQDVLTFGTAR